MAAGREQSQAAQDGVEIHAGQRGNGGWPAALPGRHDSQDTGGHRIQILGRYDRGAPVIGPGSTSCLPPDPADRPSAGCGLAGLAGRARPTDRARPTGPVGRITSPGHAERTGRQARVQWRHQFDHVVRAGHTGRRPVPDQLVTARRLRGGHRARDGHYRPVQLARVPRRVQRTAPDRRLDDNRASAQRRYDPVPHQEARPGRRLVGRVLADHHPAVADLGEQIGVPLRIPEPQAAREHRHRRGALSECAAVRGRVDAIGANLGYVNTTFRYALCMRLLAVVRLSDLTDETTSPERQREKISHYAKLHGHELAGTAEDLDVSGAVSPFEREQLGKWLAEPRLSEWDALVVAKFDRLSRSVRDFSNLIAWLEERGKVFVCLDPAIDLSNPSGRAFAHMLVTFAEFEREMIASRVRDAYHALRKSGKFPGGSVPFGYQAVRHQAKGWELVPDPDYVPVVQEMVARYLNGQSFHMISRWLNDQKIPASRDAQRIRAGRQIDAGERLRSAKPPNRNGWSPATVRKVLSSPTLSGKVLRADGEPVRDSDGLIVTISPLIPASDYARLHEDLASRRYTRRSNASKLLDIASCAWCGAPLYITTTYHKGRAYPYYLCQTRRSGSCPALRIRADDLEDYAEKIFLRAAGAAEIRDRVLIPAEDHSSDLARVDEAIANLEDQYADGHVYEGKSGAERFAAMMRKLQDRRDKLATLPSSPARIEYRPTGQTVAERWAELGGDHAARRALMAESGFKLRTCKEKHRLIMWFQLDAGLAARAAAAAEGNASVVPLPEQENWLCRTVLDREGRIDLSKPMGWRVPLTAENTTGRSWEEDEGQMAEWLAEWS